MLSQTWDWFYGNQYANRKWFWIQIDVLNIKCEINNQQPSTNNNSKFFFYEWITTITNICPSLFFFSHLIFIFSHFVFIPFLFCWLFSHHSNRNYRTIRLSPNQNQLMRAFINMHLMSDRLNNIYRATLQTNEMRFKRKLLLNGSTNI